jgi:hypothetical protein
MFKKVVNEEEFIELCNAELRRHPDFEEGMEIIDIPEDSYDFSMKDYRWKGPGSIQKIISDVVGKVREEYDYRIRPPRN